MVLKEPVYIELNFIYGRDQMPTEDEQWKPIKVLETMKDKRVVVRT